MPNREVPSQLLYDALRSSYKSSADLGRMVKFQLNEQLDAIVPIVPAMHELSLFLIMWAREHGRTQELADALIRDNPSNPKVQELRATQPGYAGADLTGQIKALLAQNRCILFAGSGLSAFSGLPTWKQLVEELIAWSASNGLTTDQSKIAKAFRSGDLDFATDLIQEQIGIEKIIEFLRGAILWQAPPHGVHKHLATLPFACVFSSNWDTLIERAFKHSKPFIFTWDQSELALESLRNQAFSILKISGSLDRPETVLLHLRALEHAIARDKKFGKLVEYALSSHSFILIGASLNTVETILRSSRAWVDVDIPHFAFIGVGEGTEWEARAESLSRYYKIHFIPYRSGSELIDLLEQLGGGTTGLLESNSAPPILKRAVFDNIGPFDHIELDFDSKWSVLLGNNGVGKSSILRALAVAFSGDAASSWADRIIKADCNDASIIVETSHLTHRTTLFRRPGGAGADVRCTPFKPLDRTLVLGFPPLRTGGWGTVSASSEAQPIPVSDDILPLVKGEADPRLDKLKQWIVNVDYRIKAAQAQGREYRQFENLLNDFFAIVGRLAEGMHLEYGGVDPETRQVSVITPEGKVPIEMVSQGTASLISWVGVLLQRLFDIYAGQPSKQHALVLIDEIDAHMHPAWQQSIIHHLQEAFPNVQFVATTHSPLIVAGRKREEVLIFERNTETGKISAAPSTIDFIGLRSDQILTSLAFRLDGATDYRTTRTQARYRELIEKAERTAQEQEEFQVLRSDEAIIARKIGESPLQAKTYTLIRDAIDSTLAAKPPKEESQLRAEIDAQIKEAMLESEMR